MIKEALNDFYETDNIICLSIALNFYFGLRIGELIALKKTDIQGNYLFIQRMLIREEEKVGDKWVTKGYKIVNHLKKDKKFRKVPIPKAALPILNMILDKATNDYLFYSPEKGEIDSMRAIDTRIRKYCNYIGTTEKSNHNIRKTYASYLYSKGLTILQIAKLLGHSKSSTTTKFYLFLMLQEEEEFEEVDRAFAS